jgi:hypothetical protein
MEEVIKILVDKFSYWQLIGLFILFWGYKKDIFDCPKLLKQMTEHFSKLETRFIKHEHIDNERHNELKNLIEGEIDRRNKNEKNIDSILEILTNPQEKK